MERVLVLSLVIHCGTVSNFANFVHDSSQVTVRVAEQVSNAPIVVPEEFLLRSFKLLGHHADLVRQVGDFRQLAPFQTFRLRLQGIHFGADLFSQTRHFVQFFESTSHLVQQLEVLLHATVLEQLFLIVGQNSAALDIVLLDEAVNLFVDCRFDILRVHVDVHFQNDDVVEALAQLPVQVFFDVADREVEVVVGVGQTGDLRQQWR
jgi:hypothetical protein